MFTIHKTDTGAVAPWEYLPAVEGTYKIGSFLRNSGGLLTAEADMGEATKYLCMAEKTVAEGELIPVVRVNTDMILKSEWSNELMEGLVVVGAVGKVSSDGAAVSSDGMDIAVEIVAMDGTNPGDTVYVRLQ